MPANDEDIAVLGLELDSRPLVQGAADVEGALGRTGKAAGALERDMMSLGKVAVGVFKGFMAFQFASWIKSTIELAARYETLGVVLYRVGEGAGYSKTRLDTLQVSLEKTGISMKESRQSIISMIQANVDLAGATKLARVAQDAAVTAGLNSSETLQRIIAGITSGHSMILRSVGLQVNFGQATKKLAQELHTSVDQLTNAQKMQAQFNATIEAGRFITGAYEAAMGTAGKQLRSTERYVEDLRVKLGTLVLPAYTAAVFAYSDALKFAENHFQTLASGIVVGAVMAIGKGLRPLGAALLESVFLQRQMALGAVMARDAELAAAQADMTRADALVLESQSMVRLAAANAENLALTESSAVATASLAAAEAEAALAASAQAAAAARVAVAEGALTTGAIVATTATDLLTGALAFFGGPIGIAILAVAAAFGIMQYNAGLAAEKLQKVREEYRQLNLEQIRQRSHANENVIKTNEDFLKNNPSIMRKVTHGTGEGIETVDVLDEAREQARADAQRRIDDAKMRVHELAVAAKSAQPGKKPPGEDDPAEKDSQLKRLRDIQQGVRDLMFETDKHDSIEKFNQHIEKMQREFDELGIKMKYTPQQVRDFKKSLDDLRDAQHVFVIKEAHEKIDDETEATKRRAVATTQGALALAEYNKAEEKRLALKQFSEEVSKNPWDVLVESLRLDGSQSAKDAEALAKVNEELNLQMLNAKQTLAIRKEHRMQEDEMNDALAIQAATIGDINAGITDPAALAALAQRRRDQQAIARWEEYFANENKSADAKRMKQAEDAKKLGEDLRGGLDHATQSFWGDFFKDGRASLEGFLTRIKDGFAALAADKLANGMMGMLFSMSTSRGGILRGGTGAAGGVTGWLQGMGLSDHAIQNMGKGAMGGLAGLGVGYGVGGMIQQSTGSGALSAVGGAASGAAAGFMVGGPVGALVGGLAGLAGGLLGAHEAAKQARLELERLRASFNETVTSIKVLAGQATPLEEQLQKNKQTFIDLRQEAEKAYKALPSFYDGGKSRDALKAKLAELNALEATRIQQLTQEAAQVKQNFRDDLQVRMLNAQGRSKEADMLRLKLQQEQEIRDAIKNKTDDATMALLRQVQAQELLAEAAKNASGQALNLVTGYKIAEMVFNAMDNDQRPLSNPAASGAAANMTTTVSLMVDGQTLSKIVVKNLQKSAQAQFGDTTRWGEVSVQ